MRNLVFLALLGATACGPGQYYNSVCDVTFYGNWDGNNATQALIKTLKRASALGLGTEQQLCKRLSNLSVEDVPEADTRGWFYSIEHRKFIGGITYCSQRLIKTNDHQNEYSLIHELFHYLEGCTYDEKAKDPYHPNWGPRRIYSTIADISNEVDYNKTHKVPYAAE